MTDKFVIISIEKKGKMQTIWLSYAILIVEQEIFDLWLQMKKNNWHQLVRSINNSVDCGKWTYVELKSLRLNPIGGRLLSFSVDDILGVPTVKRNEERTQFNLYALKWSTSKY